MSDQTWEHKNKDEYYYTIVLYTFVLPSKKENRVMRQQRDLQSLKRVVSSQRTRLPNIYKYTEHGMCVCVCIHKYRLGGSLTLISLLNSVVHTRSLQWKKEYSSNFWGSRDNIRALLWLPFWCLSRVTSNFFASLGRRTSFYCPTRIYISIVLYTVK
jgi:hypothetical protein